MSERDLKKEILKGTEILKLRRFKKGTGFRFKKGTGSAI
jgi:hypothetical protein